MSLVGVIGLLLSDAAPAIEEARIVNADGVPRVFVDGRPICPRLFCGARGCVRLPIEAFEKAYSFDFTVTGDSEKRGSLYFTPGYQDGDFYLDDITVTNLDTGERVCAYSFDESLNTPPDWIEPSSSQPQMKLGVAEGKGRNGSNALVVRFQGASQATWREFWFYHRGVLDLKRDAKYRLTFWANASSPTTCGIKVCKPINQTLASVGGDLLTLQLGYAKDANVRLFTGGVGGMPWPKPGEKPDFEAVDKAIEAVLRVNPDALVMPRFSLDPPQWWLDQHPQEELSYAGPRNANHRHIRRNVSLSSEVYKAEVNKHLRAYVEYIEKRFGAHIIGYHPCGQNTGEWFYQGCRSGGWPGYAPADLKAWRVWLADRYQTSEAMQEAWKTDRWTLATVPVPPLEMRLESKNEPFLDIAKHPQDQMLIDFNVFLQEMVVDTLSRACRTIKEATGNKKLTCVFYGYPFEIAGSANGPAITGHFALEKALKSPYVDIFSSPISYFDRQQGGNLTMMSVVDSVALAGKMWFSEDDTRTFMARDANFPLLEPSRVNTLEETEAIHQRNMANYVIRNMGCWWMDLPGTGWLNDPGIWKNLKTLHKLDVCAIANPERFDPEIGLFIDEEGLLATSNNQLTLSLISPSRMAFNRMGAPYGQYFLDDFLCGRCKPKLRVFLSVWSLDAERRAALAKKTQTGTSVWCAASGYLDKHKGASLESMQELTGFAAQLVVNQKQKVVPTGLGKRLGLTDGWEDIPQPEYFFTAADARPEETLAVYSGGAPAIAMRKTRAGGASIFVGVPRLHPQWLRFAAAQAGAHIYTRQYCNVGANHSLIVLHGSQDETALELDTGRTCGLFDAITGQNLGPGPQYIFPLKFGETRVFRFEAAAARGPTPGPLRVHPENPGRFTDGRGGTRAR